MNTVHRHAAVPSARKADCGIFIPYIWKHNVRGSFSDHPESAYKRTDLEDFHSHIPSLYVVMYLYGYNYRSK